MPLDATNFYPKGPVKSVDMRQFYDLATGVMTDQPVTYRNVLSIGGNQGLTTVPLKVYGSVGQNTNLIDLYTDRTAPQPGFGFSALGSFAWGPGGAAPQDTFMSRIAEQNGHTGSDTAGLFITPRLEVLGPVVINGALTASSLSVAGGGLGTIGATRINFSPSAFIQAYGPDNTFIELPKLTVTPGATVLAGLTVNGATTVNGALTATGIVQSNSHVNAYGGQVRFEASNAVRIDWRSDLGALYFPYGNGFYAHAGTVAGNMTVTGTMAGGQVNSRGYRTWDAADFSFGVGIAGSTLVQRDASGQIQANSVYIPAAPSGGKPVYVLGDNGDGWMRRWPATSIGPPALRSYTFTGTIPAHNGTVQNVSISGSGAGGILTNNGGSLTTGPAGYWMIGATAGGYNNVGVRIYTEGALRMDANPTPNAPDFLSPIGGHWVGFINAGGAITFQGRSQQATWGGNFTVTFVPTTDYPG